MSKFTVGEEIEVLHVDKGKEEWVKTVVRNYDDNKKEVSCFIKCEIREDKVRKLKDKVNGRIKRHEEYYVPVSGFYIDKELEINVQCKILSCDIYENDKKKYLISYKIGYEDKINTVNEDKIEFVQLPIQEQTEERKEEERKEEETIEYSIGEEVEAFLMRNGKEEWIKAKINDYDSEKNEFSLKVGSVIRYGIEAEKVRKISEERKEEMEREEKKKENRIIECKDFNPPWNRFYVDKELGIDLACQVLSVDEYENGKKEYKIRYKNESNKEIIKTLSKDKILTNAQHLELSKSKIYKEGDYVEVFMNYAGVEGWRKAIVKGYNLERDEYLLEYASGMAMSFPPNKIRKVNNIEYSINEEVEVNIKDEINPEWIKTKIYGFNADDNTNCIFYNLIII